MALSLSVSLALGSPSTSGSAMPANTITTKTLIGLRTKAGNYLTAKA